MHSPKLHQGRSSRRHGRTIVGALSMLLLGVSTFAAAPSSAPNKSLKLDGANSYVELPPDIFRDLTQATVEVWAKWSEFAPYGRIFEFGAGYKSMSLFNHASTPDLRFNLYQHYAKNDPQKMNIATAKDLLHLNEWVHLAAVSGPGGMRLYANGRLVAQHTNIASFADIHVAQTNLLGRGLARVPTDRDFHGEIDELRVWDHQRTLDQIRDNMFKRLTGKEEGLTHLWNFDDGTAFDSGPSGHHGRMFGSARVGLTDLELAAPVLAAPTVAFAATVNTNPPAVAPVAPAMIAAAPVMTVQASSNLAVWWIAGALIALVAVLVWLVLIFRRSALGSDKLLAGPSGAMAATVGTVAQLPPAGQKEIKERALAELTTFAKESLVQGLYSQRSALMEAHEKAQQELAELETRVVALQLPDRIKAYEKRIAELEGELATRGDELRELTHATLQLLRQKLEEEKKQGTEPSRLN